MVVILVAIISNSTTTESAREPPTQAAQKILKEEAKVKADSTQASFHQIIVVINNRMPKVAVVIGTLLGPRQKE